MMKLELTQKQKSFYPTESLLNARVQSGQRTKSAKQIFRQLRVWLNSKLFASFGASHNFAAEYSNFLGY